MVFEFEAITSEILYILWISWLFRIYEGVVWSIVASSSSGVNYIGVRFDGLFPLPILPNYFCLEYLEEDEAV